MRRLRRRARLTGKVVDDSVVRRRPKAAFGNGASLFVVFSYLLMIGLIGGIQRHLCKDRHALPAIPAGVIIVGLLKKR